MPYYRRHIHPEIKRFAVALFLALPMVGVMALMALGSCVAWAMPAARALALPG